MNTRNGRRLESSTAAASEPAALSNAVLAGDGVWAAKLRHKGSNCRFFDVAGPEGNFVVEYFAEGMANEWVLVDGEVACRSRSTWWFTPHFQFRLGSSDAVLVVRFWPWLSMRWLRLIVSGQIIYAEGSTGRELPKDELLMVLSDPLAADGIEVKGRWPTSVPVPTHIICEKQTTRLTLTQRWFSWMSVALVPFCLVLDAAVAVAYGVLPRREHPVIVAVVLLPGILLALWAAYYVLARLVNETVVAVTTSKVSIHHRPLPWTGGQSIALQQVKTLTCGKRTSQNYEGDVWETYTLAAILNDGREVELLHKIGSQRAVNILEREVTSWLLTAGQPALAQLAI